MGKRRQAQGRYIPTAQPIAPASPQPFPAHRAGPWAKKHMSPRGGESGGCTSCFLDGQRMGTVTQQPPAPHHALAPDADAVGVSVAAAGTIVNNLVHKHYVPRALRLADQLALLSICGKRKMRKEVGGRKGLWKYIRVTEGRNPSQLLPWSKTRFPKSRCLISLHLFAAQEPALLPSALGKLREGNLMGHSTCYCNARLLRSMQEEHQVKWEQVGQHCQPIIES